MGKTRKKIETKSVTLAVRVTPTERESVRECAADAGVREGEWIRRAIALAMLKQAALAVVSP